MKTRSIHVFLDLTEVADFRWKNTDASRTQGMCRAICMFGCSFGKVSLCQVSSWICVTCRIHTPHMTWYLGYVWQILRPLKVFALTSVSNPEKTILNKVKIWEMTFFQVIKTLIMQVTTKLKTQCTISNVSCYKLIWNARFGPLLREALCWIKELSG